jgi:chaperonin cofactor prefoldin
MPEGDAPSRGDRVNTAVTLVLQGSNEERKQGYRDLLESIFDAIDQGIRAALPREVGLNEPKLLDEVMTRFLETKLDREKGKIFLEALATASNPRSLAFKAARYFAIDELRKQKGPRLVLAPLSRDEGADEYEPAWDVDELDEDESHLERDETPSFDARYRRLLDDLSPEEHLMLCLLFFIDPGDGLIEHMARMRGISKNAVQAEIEQRFATKDEHRRELEEKRDGRRHQLRMLEKNYNTVQEAIRSRNGVASESAREPDDPATRCADEYWLIHQASPGERAGCETYIIRRLEQQAKLYKETLEELRALETSRPKYREVAMILGRITSESGEDEQKKAANTVQVQLNRIRQKIVRTLNEGADDDQ